MHVAVVMGGYSDESVISLKSGQLILNHLDSSKYKPFEVHILVDEWYCLVDNQKYPINKADFSFTKDNQTIKFDMVINTVHGTPGEDGHLQAYWELLELPYTGCGYYQSSLTFNKRDTYLTASIYFDKENSNMQELVFFTRYSFFHDLVKNGIKKQIELGSWEMVNSPEKADKEIYFELSRDYFPAELKYLRKNKKGIKFVSLDSGNKFNIEANNKGKNNSSGGGGTGAYSDENNYNTKSVLVFDDGSRWEGNIINKTTREISKNGWVGNTIKKTPEGHGIMYYTDGSVYKGTYYGGNRSGYGEMYYINGSVYKGQWLNGQKSGRGELIETNGQKSILILPILLILGTLVG